jgi:hypothetical protein
MEGRGGIGLGLAEPELSVQYVVAGGAASDHKGFFEVGPYMKALLASRARRIAQRSH